MGIHAPFMLAIILSAAALIAVNRSDKVGGLGGGGPGGTGGGGVPVEIIVVSQ